MSRILRTFRFVNLVAGSGISTAPSTATRLMHEHNKRLCPLITSLNEAILHPHV